MHKFIIPILALFMIAGSSADFEPANKDGFDMGDVTIFDESTELWITQWVNYEDGTIGGRLTNKWGGTHGTASVLFAGDGSNGFAFGVEGSNDNLYYKTTTTGGFTDDTWFFLECNWSATTTLQCYRSGTSLTMGNGVGSSADNVNNSSSSLDVGYETDEDVAPLDIRMAYIGIYNRALTAAERTEIRWKPESIDSDGWWGLWDAEGVTVKDLSGNGNDGTADATTGSGPDASTLGPPVMFGQGLPL